jgi:UPF0755 protein
LRAAAWPASTDDLYFVADGSGGHLFAKTLAEQNRNISLFRRDTALQSTSTGAADPPQSPLKARAREGQAP